MYNHTTESYKKRTHLREQYVQNRELHFILKQTAEIFISGTLLDHKYAFSII